MRTALLLFGLLIVCDINAQSSVQYDLAERIKQVENQLMPPILVEGDSLGSLSIQDCMKQFNIAGVGIAVIKDQRIEWAKSYGLADKENGRQVDENTMFQAASISKPLTALSTLHWIEKGKFELDTDVNSYLKEWKIPGNNSTNSKKVTLRLLMRHQAGITVHGFKGYAKTEPIPTIIEVLNGAKPANSAPILADTIPGSVFRYSGGGYTIIQKVLMDKLSKPFPVIMKETVFEKLGMNNSTYEQPLPDEFLDKSAIGYRMNGDPVNDIHPEMAAAGLWTTPSDLARYVIEIQKSLNGQSDKVISRKVAELMIANGPNPYGLGPMVQNQGDSLVLIHGGTNNGFRSLFITHPYKGNGVVVMTNSDYGFEIIYNLLRSVSKVYDWNFYKPQLLKKFDLSQDKIHRLIGTYMIPDYTFEIFQESGRLYLKPQWNKPAMEIMALSDTEFIDHYGQYPVNFILEVNNVKAATVYGDTFEKIR